jgi:hypothetical protein
MNRNDILYEIFHRAGTKNFITMYELEVETGMPGSKLRPIIEDLKEAGLIVEHPEGFQLSGNGLNRCRTLWV